MSPHRTARTALAALGIALCGAGPGAAQPAAGVACHDGPGYRVIQRDRADSVGADFLIRRVAGPPPRKCAFAAEPGDIRLPASAKVENAWSFLALSGERLLLDDGTAAANRNLVVVDLASGKVAGTFPTFDTARVEGGTAFVLTAGRKGTRALCPNLPREQLSGARMVSESAVDLTTLAVTPTGTTRCVYEE